MRFLVFAHMERLQVSNPAMAGHGTHISIGVQVPPKLSAMVDYTERINPVTWPDAMLGRHYRKAC